MSNVQSLDRALTILETIAVHEKGIGISEIGKITNLHKSTVYRLTSSLVENNYVEQLEDGRYHLGVKLYALGAKYFANTRLEDVAHPFLAQLAEKIGEVVHLVIRNGNEIVYVDKKNSDSNTALMGSKIGSTAPLYCTAVGKAILFNTSDKEIKALWSTMNIVARTKNTILTLDDFLTEIDLSRKRGYAFDIEENEAGITCIGVPIYDAKRHICAAISISSLSSRLPEQAYHRYALSLLRTSNEISRELGLI